MLVNNKGFFFPTLMIYIVIFLMFISFMVYNNLANQIMLKSFEQEIYYELAVIKSKKYAKEYINNSKNFKEVCKQEKLKEEIGNAHLEVEGICTMSMFGDFYEKFQENISIDNQEITPEQYEKQLKFVRDFNEYQQAILNPNFIEKNSEKIIKFAIDKFPKGEKIEDGLEALSGIVNQYIVFNMEFKGNEQFSKKEEVMAFYDYKEEEIKGIVYT